MAILFFNNAGTGNTDWSDTNNWWDTPGGTGTNGFSPSMGDNLYIETDCTQGIPSSLMYYIVLNSYFGASTVTVSSGYSLIIDSGGELAVSDLIVEGTLQISSASTLFINIIVNAGGLVSAYANCTFATSIINNGTIECFSGSIVFANLNSVNNGTISVSGGLFQLSSNYSLTNNGTITVGDYPVYILGTLNNNSLFNVSSNTRLAITPNANFNNNGTFVFGALYTTAFKGRIFPQIPSSASWGNALL